MSVAVHAQGLIHAGDEEEQSDLARGGDVGQSVEPIVARGIRYPQRLFVHHLDEARIAAARRGVWIGVTPAAGDDREGRQPDETRTVLVQVVECLASARFPGSGYSARKACALSIMIHSAFVPENRMASANRSDSGKGLTPVGVLSVPEQLPAAGHHCTIQLAGTSFTPSRHSSNATIFGISPQTSRGA